jgi:NodT family efflux transporter outer membrane factor (OMF) lipoprotein
MRTHVLALAFAALLLSGCTSPGATRYKLPELAAPDAWRHAAVPAAAATSGHWWREFQDPALTSLVEGALQHNHDLAAAAAAVRLARLQSGLTDRNALPQLSAAVGANATRSLRGQADASHAYSTSVSAGYEVDLWGRLSLQRDAAQWAAQATEQDRRSLALSLASATMGTYWRLGYLNESIVLGSQDIEHAQKTLEIARARYAAGGGTALDVLQAEQALASAQAGLAQLDYQREESRNALALLYGAPPGQAFPEPRRLPDGPLPAIAAGLPADVLSRRPDVQAAELRLRATFASGNASRMSFYPSLPLTANLGASSPALLSLLSNPAAALGTSLALPFVQWREMQLNDKIVRAGYEQAVAAFQQTFYRALGEVESALALRQQLAAQADYLDKALVTARKAERVAEIQYRAGSVPLKTWLDAQEASRAASAAVASNRLDRLLAHAALYQVLGGDAAIAATGAAQVSLSEEACQIGCMP